jgi:hypothetical protein
MSEQTIRVSRGVDLAAVMPWLVAMAVYLLLMALAGRLLSDPDTYWHIAIGRLILDQHTLPDADPFSATMRGTHWIADAWLADVAYAAAYRLGGWAAVAGLTAAAAAAAFGQLARYLLQRWQPLPATIAVLIALVLTSPHIVARPHVLALPLIVTWTAALIRAVDTAQRPPWWLLPLMTLWANLHGSFIFGLAMAGVIAAEAVWVAPRPLRLGTAKSWIAFGVLALAAACLNPYGPEMILATLRTLGLGQALSIINEWRAQDFSKLGAYEIIVLAVAGFALLRGVRLPPFRILMLLGVLHLSLAQSRHADLLGMLAPLFLARPLAEQFGALAASRSVTERKNWRWLPVPASLLVCAAIGGVIAARGNVTPAAANTPANALAAVQNGPIFNSYEFGGYLDFVGRAPFLDGRTDLYGEAFMMRYIRAVSLEDLPDFLRLLHEYHIETTLLTPSAPANSLLDRLPEWRRVYADDVAVVHARRAALKE